MPLTFNCSFNQTDPLRSVMWAVRVSNYTPDYHIKYFAKINTNESHTEIILPTHRPWYVTMPIKGCCEVLGRS